nr:hypothetical protein [Marinicella sp. W31]MDC2876968.1 hypothetical protein [Marinicella sp. W31]
MLLGQLLCEAIRKQERRLEVDGEMRIELCFIKTAGGIGAKQRGIVDEQMNRAHRRVDRIKKPAGCRGIEKVSAEGLRCHTRPTQRFREFFGLGQGRVGMDCHIEAVIDEVFDDGTAKSLAPPVTSAVFAGAFCCIVMFPRFRLKLISLCAVKRKSVSGFVARLPALYF